MEGQRQLSHELCSVHVLVTSAFATDDMLMRTGVKVIARRPTGRRCFGVLTHTCSVCYFIA